MVKNSIKTSETPTGHRVEMERDRPEIHLVVFGEEAGQEHELLRITKDISDLAPEEVTDMIMQVLDMPTAKVYRDLLEALRKQLH
jgi:hypothetical protein